MLCRRHFPPPSYFFFHYYIFNVACAAKGAETWIIVHWCCRYSTRSLRITNFHSHVCPAKLWIFFCSITRAVFPNCSPPKRARIFFYSSTSNFKNRVKKTFVKFRATLFHSGLVRTTLEGSSPYVVVVVKFFSLSRIYLTSLVASARGHFLYIIVSCTVLTFTGLWVRSCQNN